MSSMLMDERTAPPEAGVDLGGLAGQGLLAVAEQALGRLGQELLGGALADGALTDSVVALQRVETMAFAEKLRRIAEIDQRQAYVAEGARTTADLLASRCGLTRAEGCAQADVARALARMPDTAARLARGELSAGQALVAARALRDMEAAAKAQADAAAKAAAAAERAARRAAETDGGAADSADADTGAVPDAGARDDADAGAAEADPAERAAERAAAEAEAAAERAARLDKQVAGSGAADRNELRGEIDEWTQREGVVDGLAARERAAHANRRLWVGRRADGAVGVEGRLDVVGGARVAAAIDALARPAGKDDQRSFAQRRADALVALAGQALDPHESSEPAPDGGPPPDSQPQAGAHDGSHSGGAQAGASHGGSSQAAGSPAGASTAGPPAQVLLITTVGALHDTPGAQASQLDGVGAVCNATARQICCDAEVTLVTMTRNGAVLDVGRARREPSVRQRAAVIARDRACVGCGAPVARCQVHHVHWWRRGGPTDIANLTLLCWSCHTHVHHHGWTVHRDQGGGFTITRPTDPQPGRRQPP